MAGSLLVVQPKIVRPEWPDGCARVLEVPGKMGQCMDSRVIIHGGKPEGINLEMSNVCAREPGTEHDHEPTMPVTGSTNPVLLNLVLNHPGCKIHWSTDLPKSGALRL
ncbi:hypothetical protein PISMIDRAFT_672461 [Pisolithus microcarpus 441]|uniref:Uncharacterized protein n=1 Tax=Pisolithus microcarpus 441 TaxID=765257 RepID=A0A0C9YVK3_9AGAM|nr:hypothetical protein PISMIDRAFT_672461 [Pisolithus microcarpus 441]